MAESFLLLLIKMNDFCVKMLNTESKVSRVPLSGEVSTDTYSVRFNVSIAPSKISGSEPSASIFSNLNFVFL